MPPEIIEFIGPLAAMITIGTIVLVGMKMRLNAKAHMQGNVGREEMERLTDGLDHLHEEVRLLRDEFADLQERVEFAERLLTRGTRNEDAHDQNPTPV